MENLEQTAESHRRFRNDSLRDFMRTCDRTEVQERVFGLGAYFRLGRAYIEDNHPKVARFLDRIGFYDLYK